VCSSDLKGFVAKIENPAGCKYYFGYLGTLARGSLTPDECYACTELIDCLKENKD
jgi:hypothetical protein